MSGAAPLGLPAEAPTWDGVRLRPYRTSDVPMLRDLATDPYVPLIGTLPARATEEEALAYIQRQHDRLLTGTGYSFAVTLEESDEAVGGAGLWLGGVEHGRASAGYSIAPQFRGQGLGGRALIALTAFAWTLPEIHRVELFIETWNAASIKTALEAGYSREGLLRSHQEIGGTRVDMELFAALRVGG
ncbi:GNAT family N-acetyltransferase [Ornithinimicrobium sp. Y1694]|uniref:GNAT family N-acetyltransferase n=1 Tax=Ornithinimicrobium sp. Y1694 TaxID=3418590 RepID=UPI003CF01BB5